MLKLYPITLAGNTKGGFPLWIERLGKIDLDGLRRLRDSTRKLIRHNIFMYEYVYNLLLDPTDPVRKIFLILDLEGAYLSNLVGDAWDYLKTILLIGSQHYPDFTIKTFIVNAPRSLYFTYRLLGPFISTQTKAKVKIVRDKLTMQRLLLEHFAPENLPVCYGGADRTPLNEHNNHIELLKFVDELNGCRKNGVVSPEVVTPVAAKRLSECVGSSNSSCGLVVR